MKKKFEYTENLNEWSFLLGVEIGYIQCEKGNNLHKAKDNALKIYKGEDYKTLLTTKLPYPSTEEAREKIKLIKKILP